MCYFSKSVEDKRLSFKHPSTNTLIEHFKDLFSVYGVPMKLFSGNHLYNSSEFKLFAKSIDMTLSTSSPRYALSNGLSEICVKTVKDMLKNVITTVQTTAMVYCNIETLRLVVTYNLKRSCFLTDI